ncbi:uncharacterized protein STEHIDRAFT_153356 [Stereum hirsutum FP-91666 SS1]|uniref:uncharacterized protein n=1 Tax=Stereum hirsutum (strain FP-91666) TaxID=721885 RepID=UPI000440F9E0|nr:uncharacterized protein STEHIDRAFT_153356 [Stereum hirsutum FP-91666 SS1]EIM89495.1 hypothetical protein STEHIDRAFT_153356 [Stereum hirsutum FP-91666 SS1]
MRSMLVPHHPHLPLPSPHLSSPLTTQIKLCAARPGSYLPPPTVPISIHLLVPSQQHHLLPPHQASD